MDGSFHSVNPAASRCFLDVCTAWNGSGEESINSIASFANGMNSSYREESGGSDFADAFSVVVWHLPLFCIGMAVNDATKELPILVVIVRVEDCIIHADDALTAENRKRDDGFEIRIAVVLDEAEFIVCSRAADVMILCIR